MLAKRGQDDAVDDDESRMIEKENYFFFVFTMNKRKKRKNQGNSLDIGTASSSSWIHGKKELFYASKKVSEREDGRV